MIANFDKKYFLQAFQRLIWDAFSGCSIPSFDTTSTTFREKRRYDQHENIIMALCKADIDGPLYESWNIFMYKLQKGFYTFKHFPQLDYNSRNKELLKASDFRQQVSCKRVFEIRIDKSQATILYYVYNFIILCFIYKGVN